MSYEAAPTPSPTASPYGPNVAPTPGAAPSAAPPGIDPGFLQQYMQSHPTGASSGSDQIWYSEAGAGLVVRSNGSLHPNGKEPLMKISDVMYQFWNRDQKWVDALAAKLMKAGFLTSVNVTRSDVWEAFRAGPLMEAATSYQANLQAGTPNKAQTVEQVLQGFMKRPVGDAAAQNKPAQYTTTNTQTNLSDPTEANNVLMQTLQDRLGRAPTDAEKHSFLAALNAAQRANPTVTSTQYTLNQKTGGYDTTTGTTSGGVNAAQVADDFTMKNNKVEHGAYQAATTYFDAMMGALGAPGGV